MFANFLEDLRSITMLSINYLKIANFYSLKLCIKNEFKDHIGTNFDMCVKSKKTYNPTIRFSKYVAILVLLKKVIVLNYN